VVLRLFVIRTYATNSVIKELLSFSLLFLIFIGYLFTRSLPFGLPVEGGQVFAKFGKGGVAEYNSLEDMYEKSQRKNSLFKTGIKPDLQKWGFLGKKNQNDSY